jgi:hypothetical protein
LNKKDLKIREARKDYETLITKMEEERTDAMEVAKKAT